MKISWTANGHTTLKGLHGENPVLEPDEIAAGVTSVSIVETEPGIRLRCLEYYNDVQNGSFRVPGDKSNDPTFNHTEKDQVILLLHGFPDTPMTWNGVARNLISATSTPRDGNGIKPKHDISSRHGRFLVVCPELRGYSTAKNCSPSTLVGGDKVEDYSREKILGDLDALRKYYCGDHGSFELLVGHDWGGVVVWSALEDQEEQSLQRIAQKAAVLNLPHPLSFGENIVRPSQLLKSLYIFFFQVPILSEWFLSRNRGSYLREIVMPNRPRHRIDETTIQQQQSIERHYLRVLSQQGFIDKPILYYRAAAAGLWGSYGGILKSYPPIVAFLIKFGRMILRTLYGISADASRSNSVDPAKDFGASTPPVVIKTPVLVLWGSNDPYLGKNVAKPPTHLVQKLRGPILYKAAGHWVHWDNQKEVCEELLNFIFDSKGDV